MTNFTGRFTFIIVLFFSVALLFSCSKLKDLKDKTEDVKKEDTKKEETKKEDTKKDDDKKTTSGSESKLYFCERYDPVDGEINISKRFSTGYLTVMVDTRPADKVMGASEVEIVIYKIKDGSGNSISEKKIKSVPFTVKPTMNYVYFENKKDLKFTSTGTYRVVCQKKSGSEIAEGEIEIIP